MVGRRGPPRDATDGRDPGGGGGGWFGGGGGWLSSGGGGSGYISGSTLSGSMLTGVHAGDGKVTIYKS